MELFDLLLVAERIRPPARNIVHAFPFHLAQKFQTAVRRPGQLLLLIRLAGFLGPIRWAPFVTLDLRDLAEESLAMEG